MQQPMTEEIHSLLSTESIKVACSSVLKEMAVDCDLTDLEEVILLGKSVPLLWSWKAWISACFENKYYHEMGQICTLYTVKYILEAHSVEYL